MMKLNRLNRYVRESQNPKQKHYDSWQPFHLDIPLLIGILLLVAAGLFILYSASNQSMGMMERQGARIVLGLIIMVVLAQIPPEQYRVWAPWFFITSLLLLIAVFFLGHIHLGARRWLNLGLFHLQPSELMKLALPMTLAWYFQDKPLPPTWKHLGVGAVIIGIPFLLIAKEPDLGTALLIACTGGAVFLFAGIRWRLLGYGLLAGILSAPVLWHFMRDYQKQRVLTFLNPERDPLGSGYHIIQSKIAIGSGGLFGEGWLHGTQAHLQFLPEHATDFVYAVCGEELGLIGGVALIAIYMAIIMRSIYIATQAQDTFTRLLAGTLSLTFFLSMFINIGMVTGILPVVGLPLPLVSYGGTSVVTVLASFGILMSIHSHRRLVAG